MTTVWSFTSLAGRHHGGGFSHANNQENQDEAYGYVAASDTGRRGHLFASVDEESDWFLELVGDLDQIRISDPSITPTVTFILESFFLCLMLFQPSRCSYPQQRHMSYHRCHLVRRRRHRICDATYLISTGPPPAADPPHQPICSGIT